MHAVAHLCLKTRKKKGCSSQYKILIISCQISLKQVFQNLQYTITCTSDDPYLSGAELSSPLR